jgi:hypothetical protein
MAPHVTGVRASYLAGFLGRSSALWTSLSTVGAVQMTNLAIGRIVVRAWAFACGITATMIAGSVCAQVEPPMLHPGDPFCVIDYDNLQKTQTSASVTVIVTGYDAGGLRQIVIDLNGQVVKECRATPPNAGVEVNTVCTAPVSWTINPGQRTTIRTTCWSKDGSTMIAGGSNPF